MSSEPGTEGKLIEIRRFPVKSLAGESLDAAEVDRRGLTGDRLWAVADVDGKLGSGKSTRRFRRMDGLMRLHASYDGAVPVVRFADGATRRGDDPCIHEALSRYVGREVRLAPEEAVSFFDDGPVSIMTTAALRALGQVVGEAVDPRRFRANLLVDWPGTGWVEDAWVGRTVAVGSDVVVRVEAPFERCVMVDLAQEDLRDDGRILRTLAEHHGLSFAMLATVERPGKVRVGDRVAAS